jgi:uncharacterized membrane protein (UPF0136 family)
MLVVFLFLAPVTILLIALFHSQFSLILELLRISAGAAFFLLSFIGWGSLFLRGEMKKKWHLSIALGIATLYVISILLALAGFFRPIPVSCLTTFGALLGIYSVPRRVNFSAWLRVDRILLSVILLLAGMRIVCSWTPLISYDSFVYQFFTPAQYLKYGHFVYMPWNVYTNSPIALQMTLGTSLAIDASGQTFKMLITLASFSMPVAAALLLIDSNRTAALLASLFTLTYPPFWTPDALGTIDLAVAGFLVLGIHYLRNALKATASVVPYSLASGAAIGLALASRYQAILIIIPALLVVFFEKTKATGRIKKISITVATMLLFSLPWIFKNWIYTGNPIFPAFYEQLGGANWSVDQSQRLNFDVFGAPLAAFHGFEKIIVPFRLLIVEPYNAVLGPFLLGCAFLALVSRRDESRPYNVHRLAAIIGWIALLAWGLIHPVADVRLVRFNAAAILFLMIASAGYLLETGKRAGLALALVVSLISLPFGLRALLRVFPVYGSVTDSEFRKNLQHVNIPAWPAIEKANEQLDERNKVLLLGETRGFPLRVPCVCPSAFNTPQIAVYFQPIDQPDRWHLNFKRDGITHVLVSLKEWSRLQDMRVYGYMNLPQEDQLRIIRWLQNQKLIYADRSGNALVEIKDDTR